MYTHTLFKFYKLKEARYMELDGRNEKSGLYSGATTLAPIFISPHKGLCM
jgi:hypothetical protein